MNKKTIRFSQAHTTYYFDVSLQQIEGIVSKNKAILITDKNVYSHHKIFFENWNVIVIPPGEKFKTQETVSFIIQQLIQLKADRHSIIVGVGGGVVTDIAGYVAGIYMRGLSFGFIPTSLLAMVDASIGGKNGIDVGVYKNMVGLIRQPSFLIYHYSFLKTLPQTEWKNGFAEIIKHACIKDAALFRFLQQHRLDDFQDKPRLLQRLIRQNVLLKTKIVQRDEWEKGDRKLLNFGHTFGHAIENTLELSHGYAVSIGMSVAAALSVISGFLKEDEYKKILYLIAQYGLPRSASFNLDEAYKIIQTDKKRFGKTIHFILLEKIGKAFIHPFTTDELKQLLPKALSLSS